MTDLGWFNLEAFLRRECDKHPADDPPYSSTWVDLKHINWIAARRYRDEDGNLMFYVQVSVSGQSYTGECSSEAVADAAVEKLKDLCVQADTGHYAFQTQLMERVTDRLGNMT